MENLVQLIYDWEIELLVLLSFTIQMFLFFTGGLRQCNTNALLRLSIWIAYLGADTVAVYALGYLTRHEQDAHPLAFFWAPFLLVHLGGQDTITAFSMEDNNLWLRHLLNFSVQCALAIYVFWESIGRHDDVLLLISGILVFVTGFIKYGERIWSLRCGSFEVLEGLSGAKNLYGDLPDQAAAEPKGHDNVNTIGYDGIVCMGLGSMAMVFDIFVGRFTPLPSDHRNIFEVHGLKPVVKVLEIELGVMYNDLYTKALVLRTRWGMVLRCISQGCALVAFILFFASHRGRYIGADVAITYFLFTGGLLLEVCGAISLMASPWTWAWLKARKYRKLAWFSWFLFSIELVGWPEKRPLWSNAIGQYNLRGWLEEHRQSSSFNQRSMTVVRKLVTSVGVEKKRLFWMSKFLDTEYVSRPDRLLECLLKGVHALKENDPDRDRGKCREYGPIFIRYVLTENNFGLTIARLHLITELYLSRYSASWDVEKAAAEDVTDMEEDCRKLSRYMMYLLVTSPSLLPLGESVAATLEEWQLGSWKEDLVPLVPQGHGKETLEEIKELWIWLVIYAAGNSRPAVHAAQLARGGELLTFVWMLLGHYGFQPTGNRIHLTRPDATRHRYEFYALDFDASPSTAGLVDAHGKHTDGEDMHNKTQHPTSQ